MPGEIIQPEVPVIVPPHSDWPNTETWGQTNENMLTGVFKITRPKNLILSGLIFHKMKKKEKKNFSALKLLIWCEIWNYVIRVEYCLPKHT